MSVDGTDASDTEKSDEPTANEGTETKVEATAEATETAELRCGINVEPEDD